MQIGDYVIGPQVGAGAFSTVHLCFNHNTGDTRVIKVIQRDVLDSMKEVEQIRREVTIFSQLDHPNIVTYYEYIEEGDLSFIIMERIEGETLLDFINANKLQEEKFYQYVFFQLCKAIQYLHQKGIAHRDIKLDNIMIDKVHNIKLLDFGLCNYQDDALLSTFCGSLSNSPPEIINNVPYDGFAVDMWSLGVILYSMLTKQLPWPIGNPSVTVDSIRRASYRIPSYVSYGAQKLIEGLIKVKPEERMTIDQVCEDPWLQAHQYGITTPDKKSNSLILLQQPHHNKLRKRNSNATEYPLKMPANQLVRPVVNGMETISKRRPSVISIQRQDRYKANSVKPSIVVK